MSASGMPQYRDRTARAHTLTGTSPAIAWKLTPRLRLLGGFCAGSLEGAYFLTGPANPSGYLTRPMAPQNHAALPRALAASISARAAVSGMVPTFVAMKSAQHASNTKCAGLWARCPRARNIPMNVGIRASSSSGRVPSQSRNTPHVWGVSYTCTLIG